jgi:hypothetical protein
MEGSIMANYQDKTTNPTAQSGGALPAGVQPDIADAGSTIAFVIGLGRLTTKAGIAVSAVMDRTPQHGASFSN